MLLTITYTGENAANLGYLFHKNPSRPQTAEFNFGKVHVFYPEVSVNRCTAALLLDMDLLDLARKAGVSFQTVQRWIGSGRADAEAFNGFSF